MLKRQKSTYRKFTFKKKKKEKKENSPKPRISEL